MHNEVLRYDTRPFASQLPGASTIVTTACSMLTILTLILGEQDSKETNFTGGTISHAELSIPSTSSGIIYIFTFIKELANAEKRLTIWRS